MAAVLKGNLKEPPIKWKVREQLILASAVQRSGDQNWVSVSRSVKPFADEARPPEFYSQKNCATQYSSLLDKAGTPRRKRKEDGTQESVETVEEQIVRHLTSKRIKELDRNLLKIKDQYMSMKRELELIAKGELDGKLIQLLEEDKGLPTDIGPNIKQKQPPLVKSQSSSALITTPTTESEPVKNTITVSVSSDGIGHAPSSGSGQVKDEPTFKETEVVNEKATPIATPTKKTAENDTESNVAEEIAQDIVKPQEKADKGNDDLPMEIDSQPVTIATKEPSDDEGSCILIQEQDDDASKQNEPMNVQEEEVKTDSIEPMTESVQEEDTTIVEPQNNDTQKEQMDLSQNIGTPTANDAIATPTLSPSHDSVKEEVASPHKDDTIDKTEDLEKVLLPRKKTRRKLMVKMSDDKRGVVDDGESETEEEYKNETEDEDYEEEVVSPRPLPRRTSGRRGAKKRDISWDSNKESPLLKSAKSSKRSTRHGDKEDGSPAPPTGRRGRGRRGRGRVKAESWINPKLEEESDDDLMSSAMASPTTSHGDNESETPQALRTWRKTIMLVWRHASQHKYANLFLHPVKEEDAPGYHDLILRPMDLSTIKKNIETGIIRTDVEFQRDMMLMFQNALMYNSSDHDVYKMAEEMRNDVVEHIQEYLMTQLMVQSSASKALRSRDASSSCKSTLEETIRPKKVQPTPSTTGTGDDTPVSSKKGRVKPIKQEPRPCD